MKNKTNKTNNGRPLKESMNQVFKIQTGRWDIAWARICHHQSGCQSSGQCAYSRVGARWLIEGGYRQHRVSYHHLCCSLKHNAQAVCHSPGEQRLIHWAWAAKSDREGAFWIVENRFMLMALIWRYTYTHTHTHTHTHTRKHTNMHSLVCTGT